MSQNAIFEHDEDIAGSLLHGNIENVNLVSFEDSTAISQKRCLHLLSDLKSRLRSQLSADDDPTSYFEKKLRSLLILETLLITLSGTYSYY